MEATVLLFAAYFALLAWAMRRGHRVLASTRRRDTLDQQRVYLDFESDEPFRVPAGIDYAFIVAAKRIRSRTA